MTLLSDSCDYTNNQDILSALKEFAGENIAGIVSKGPFVKSYSFNSINYSDSLAEHVKKRTPCLVMGCFTLSDNQDSLVNMTCRIEKEFMAVRDYIEPMVWIEEYTRKTPLHFDDCDNQMFVLKGVKVFILYPPEEHRFLYHPRGFFGFMRTSRANLEKPDFQRFPKLKKARPLVAILKPGDMLYFPTDWSHQVYSVGGTEKGPGFALNYWFPVGISPLWKSRSSDFLVFLWALIINLLVKMRFALLGQRSKMAEPENDYYKKIYPDPIIYARYKNKHRAFLDQLRKQRLENTV